MSFSTNLKYYIKKKGYNTVSLSKKLDVSAGAIGFWQKGSRFPKKPETIEKLIDILDITAIDLFGDKKKHTRKIVLNEINNNLESYLPYLPKKLIPSNIKDIPVTKGYPTANHILQENDMQYATNIYIDKRLVKSSYQDKELKAVVMIGDSMSPYLENDDIAIYHPLSAPIGDGRYVINTPHGLTVKKLKFLANGKIRLISENSDYNTMGNYDEEFSVSDTKDVLEIYGLVVGRILKS